MLIWSLLFLVTALALYGSSFGWITGHPVKDAKFMALIFVALFLVSALCIGISVKMACPASDKWLNLPCFHSGLVNTL